VFVVFLYCTGAVTIDPMDLREIRYESVDWVELIQCGGQME